uniref:Leucine Rich Repeat family protein n=1 Tax=Solanum tuberosum TaxID=4113 RepID=M1CPB4_SOLTU
MKSELEIKVKGIGIRKIPSSIIQHQALLTKLDLSVMEKLVALPSSIGMLKDGGLSEDIGSLSSLKELHLNGNNFVHLPEIIAQLGDLETFYLSNCKRLPQLPEFSKQLHTISADWSNDLICNSLFQNISSASDSLSLRALVSWGINIPHWFHHQGTSTSVSVNLPKHWYVRDNFLGFVVCYSGKLFDMTAHLIPLCDDGISGITEKLALSNHSECNPEIAFLLIPLSGLWDTSKANGRTPNDYGLFMLYFYGEMKHYGLRLLYKVDPELDANFSSSKKYSNILGRVVSFSAANQGI